MMVGKLIDGKAFAAGLRIEIGDAAAAFTAASGRKPGLAVVLVGDDAASAVYVRSKGKATIEAGMESFEFRRPASIEADDLLELIEELNGDPRVDGILVQLPLPDHIDEQAVIAAIDPSKDVDGFHIVNSGKLAVGDKSAMVPCTPLGCLMLLKDELGDLSGMEAVVLGRSNIVGKPMAQLLLAESCTVTVAHSRTRDLASVVYRADIVVAAVGRPEMVKGEWIKPGATVIDVGINRIPAEEDGKTRIVGDVATSEALSHVRAITPVPGGVGPMTIAVLLRNTLLAAHLREGMAPPAGL
ncbi:MAG: bifunctional methylenetetrahydrofolate dehydrogenase/methenyltetrahydrofolate cyclohydrolase FolD [Sphingobium sp.]|nr:bifunctional methylenetetrahydrofolate dehydrogenase/methenyltetrahydrofolate cyclohydrolase FolD [Sphingobium sp.]